MNVQVQIPDELARFFLADGEPSPPDLPRAVLEALALEGYRSRRLSESQVRRLLQMETRIEVHAFMKAHGVPLDYSALDLENDLRSIEGFESKLTSQAG
jgi:hypothetical protein